MVCNILFNEKMALYGIGYSGTILLLFLIVSGCVFLTISGTKAVQ
jgi:hypothetical protein